VITLLKNSLFAEQSPSSAGEEVLQAFEDIAAATSGILHLQDTARLIWQAINQGCRYQAAELILLDSSREKPLVAFVSEGSKLQTGDPIAFDLVTDCLTSGCLSADGDVTALPLKRGEQTFGVLLVHGAADVSNDTLSRIGEKVSPLILAALAAERTRSHALIDAVTDLPNERAFTFALERQIALSHGDPDRRPVSIVALDIKSFAELNLRYGHAIGNLVLNDAARSIKNSLREMDLVARSGGDEFLILLPRATTDVARQVIDRIGEHVQAQVVAPPDAEPASVTMNAGWSTFAADGQTPAQLVTAARIRRDRGKPASSNTVLLFSRT
jgi:diguanylate cyclase (GGDEF)-like protein